MGFSQVHFLARVCASVRECESESERETERGAQRESVLGDFQRVPSSTVPELQTTPIKDEKKKKK